MAGYTAQGLTIKRLADLREDLEDGLVAAFGPSTRVGPDSVFGQLIGVFAAELALVWELEQQGFDSIDPDAAEGAALDSISSLVGVRRQGATFSVGEVTLSGDAGSIIGAGTVLEGADTGDRFETVADATIGAGGSVDVGVRGVEVGPLAALAGTLTEIVTPRVGLDSVTNGEDVVPGRLVETDAELRLRREQSLSATGAGVDRAIRAALLALTGVQAALVISNRSNVVDANGIPPHAFECVLYPNPSDPDFNKLVAETIFERQPAGILAHGDNTFDVTDAQGYTQQVGFSYATEVELYVAATITTGPEYPADGDDQVAAALLAEGEGLSPGDDVKVWKFVAALDSILGITDVSIAIEDTPAPTSTANVAIALTEIADFDSSRITVSSS